MLIIGIDPGASGGIAITNNSSGKWLYGMEKIPDSRRDLIDRLAETKSMDPFAYVEKIHPAIPAIGKAEMSKLYGSYKELSMALVALKIPMEEVMPVDWQRGLKCPVRLKAYTQSQWKNKLKGFAQELFPDLKVTLWNCDALLIAEYGRRIRTGEIKSGETT